MTATIVDYVASAMPWAGSAIPAVMTYQNVQKLGLLPWQAVVVGLVVEGMGFVCITTAIDIYEANQVERKSRELFDPAFWVAIAGAAVYLAAVLLVNAILDGGDAWQKVTLGLLSLFGVIGGIMIALRNQLGKRLVRLSTKMEIDTAEKQKAEALALEREREEREFAHHLEEEKLRLAHETDLKKIEEENLRKIEKIRAETLRKAPAQSPDSSGGSQKVTGGAAASVRRWPDVPEGDWEWIIKAPVSEIVKRYGIQGEDPKRQARTWKKYAKEAIEKRVVMNSLPIEDLSDEALEQVLEGGM
jgi:hypothetical protein